MIAARDSAILSMGKISKRERGSECVRVSRSVLEVREMTASVATFHIASTNLSFFMHTHSRTHPFVHIHKKKERKNYNH